MRIIPLTLGLLAGAAGLLTSCQPATSSQPYLEQKAAFHTRLTRRGPAPQGYAPLRSDETAALVTYPSGPLRLQGLLARPAQDSTRRPALLYLHGGFALSASDLDDCAPFREAGYVVFAPAYRGENGNPGQFELFWGEVDDAAAAVRWLARQPYVDSTRIYAFGHSAGAGVAELLALRPALPMRLSGSSGGMYEASFTGWEADKVPFDRQDPQEGRLRVLREHLPWLQRPHYAYLGTADEGVAAEIALLQRQALGTKLTVEPAPGDHFSSLEPAMRQFLTVINR